MTREEVAHAIDVLAAQGLNINSHTVREVIGRGSYRDIQAHLDALEEERAAPAVAEVPDTAAQVAQAEAALEAARQHVATLKEQHAPVLRQFSLLRAAVPNSQDPAWFDYNQVWGLIAVATKAVERAEQDLHYARQAHDLHCYELAAAEVAQTPEGRVLLAKIEDYQRQREAADAKGSPAAFSWGMVRDQARQEFRNLVNVHRGLMKPKTAITEEERQQGLAGAVAEIQRGNPAHIHYR